MLKQDPLEAARAAAANKLNLPAIPMRKPGLPGQNSKEEVKKPDALGFGAKFGMQMRKGLGTLQAAAVEVKTELEEAKVQDKNQVADNI